MAWGSLWLDVRYRLVGGSKSVELVPRSGEGCSCLFLADSNAQGSHVCSMEPSRGCGESALFPVVTVLRVPFKIQL